MGLLDTPRKEVATAEESDIDDIESTIRKSLEHDDIPSGERPCSPPQRRGQVRDDAVGPSAAKAMCWESIVNDLNDTIVACFDPDFIYQWTGWLPELFSIDCAGEFFVPPGGSSPPHNVSLNTTHEACVIRRSYDYKPPRWTRSKCRNVISSVFDDELSFFKASDITGEEEVIHSSPANASVREAAFKADYPYSSTSGPAGHHQQQQPVKEEKPQMPVDAFVARFKVEKAEIPAVPEEASQEHVTVRQLDGDKRESRQQEDLQPTEVTNPFLAPMKAQSSTPRAIIVGRRVPHVCEVREHRREGLAAI
eukprot:gnl/TRDRNA2_/TRDRNA2_134145_c0_seq2.p1 gnl/TRDRNA2_/TRDRNA2_134145_c0~~gnl/TRDRNA2_/TRDRNA2_134145_c0_seq2.p1  ORF type:complete len:308 (+),score=41.04 gnl/TRDRNA2_/TRDRNA2_134145_c0_seq2:40-963(+)